MSATPNNPKIMEAYDGCRRVFLLTSQFKSRCKYANQKFEKVSNWSVGQHIEHTLAVNAKAVLVLSCDPRSVDALTVPQPSDMAVQILKNGGLPRGVAKAQDAVMPKMANFVDLIDDVDRKSVV